MIFALVCTTLGISQTTLNAVILGEVPLGNYSYYIAESGSQHFKSTMCTPNSLLTNSNITLTKVEDETYKFINNNGEVVLFRIIQDKYSEIIPEEIKWLLPSMIDDILYFENQKHLFDFQDKVNNYLSGFSGSVQETQMNLIMSNFSGFYSFHQYFIDKYDVFDKEFTEREIDEMNKVDCVNDFVLKHLLNSHKVLGVASEVHAWHSTELILSVAINDLSRVKNYLYEVCDNNNLDPWSATYPLFQSGLVTFRSENISKNPLHKNILILDAAGDNLRYQSIPTPIHIVESCNKFKKALKMELFEETTTAVYDPGTNSYHNQVDYHAFPNTYNLVIDWGDGGSLQTINNYTGDEIEHTYASEGNFYPIVKIMFDDINGQSRFMYDGTYAPTTGSSNIPLMPFPINFATNLACSTQDKELPGSKTEGNYRLDAKIWVNHNIFGHHIGSYTHSWKKNGNGKWKRKIGKIYCNVHGTFRNEACEVTETKSGSDTENQERVQETVTKLFRKYKAAGNNSIYSEHHLTNDGTYINLTLTLTPCP